MTKQELEKVFSYHKWRQKIFINDGIYTPGHIDNNIWKDLGLPESVNGLTILDIGSNDGQIAFEAEKRGAKKVYASDLYINKLETMANGWPIEGISILKEVKKSNIIIHEAGLFGLDSIKEHFDIVILNNVLNWIGDIDMVIKQLSKLSFDKLYLADQFLTNNKEIIKRAPQALELKAFKELCNKKYLIAKMEDFEIKLIKSTQYSILEKYINKFITQNNIVSDVEVNSYEYPDPKAKEIMKLKISSVSYYVFNGFYFIRNIGWVSKEDVECSKNKVNLILRVFKNVRLLKVYVFLKEIFKKSETMNYVLVFKKSKYN
jgi:SAM-dependent methyltransferase